MGTLGSVFVAGLFTLAGNSILHQSQGPRPVADTRAVPRERVIDFAPPIEPDRNPCLKSKKPGDLAKTMERNRERCCGVLDDKYPISKMPSEVSADVINAIEICGKSFGQQPMYDAIQTCMRNNTQKTLVCKAAGVDL